MPRKPREDGRNARTVANNKYNVTAYDRIAVNVKKGQRDVIKQYVESNGETVNTLINRLLSDEIADFQPIAK